MFKRFRQLHISLAAKCQLLFGAAVLLIIAAALFVPWWRMEQLMDQLNEKTARTLAEVAEDDHVARQVLARNGATTQPATVENPEQAPLAAAATRPSTPPGLERATVRMVLLHRPPRDLSQFERGSLNRFEQNPRAEPRKSEETPASYRYTRPLFAKANCMGCHAEDVERSGVRVQGSGEEPFSPPSPEPGAQPPLLGLVSVQIPYQAEANQVYLNRIFIFLAGTLAGTLAIIVFYLITTRLILGPVRVLQETAEKVSKGDLNIRSSISTGDEFQQLSETFNRMLTNLQAGEDQLRAINASLDMKLGQLAESNLALYESNRLKSEFLANVSHELRTPLNSILGFAELLKDSAAATDGKGQRYMQNIISSGKNLLDLINDLLDLAKIEAGRMEVRSEPLSLNDLMEGLINIIRPLAEKKELSIATQIARDVPILQTDPAKLQQVLYNFLSNAIKFSPNGGKIEVKAERYLEGRIRIEVTDQGPGIEPDKHQVIFEKFRQIDGSVTRQHSGTGLGLAISKELTTLLGGTIGVQSRTGEGATFWVVLPVKIQAHVQPMHVMVDNR